MNTDIFPEAEYFLSSFLLGVLLLFFYDWFRILRRMIRHTWFFVALEDIVFWAIGGIISFYLVYEKNYGIVRAYAGFGMVLGMWLYYRTISKHFVLGVTHFLKKTGHVIYQFFYRLTYPLRFIVLKCSKTAGKIESKWKEKEAKRKKRLEEEKLAKQKQEELKLEKKKQEKELEQKKKQEEIEKRKREKEQKKEQQRKKEQKKKKTKKEQLENKKQLENKEQLKNKKQDNDKEQNKKQQREEEDKKKKRKDKKRKNEKEN